MKKEELELKMEDLKVKMQELGEKTKDAAETAQIKGMYAKDKIDEMIIEAKGHLNAARENYKLVSDRVKSKASSELLKAQMNIDVAREEAQAKKEVADKESFEDYIETITEYASACAELALLASEEAKLAALEAIAAEKEYEEKYGEEE